MDRTGLAAELLARRSALLADAELLEETAAELLSHENRDLEPAPA